MQTEQPLVSVLMTAYNREQYIAEAIESVQASTYTNFELIIVDDKSKDRTVEIAETYAVKDARIRVVKNEQNLGDYGNRNKAASAAKGDYLMYVDSDDRILKNGIERCVKAMLQFPQAGFALYVKDHGNGQPYAIDSTTAIREHFLKRPFLMCGPGGTIQKRSFFESVKGYPTKYGPANDMYYNLKAASQTTIVKLPFEFMFYRLHEGQEINNKYAYLSNGYSYLKDAVAELELPLTAKEKKWLLQKNDRRMFVNLVKFFLKEFDFDKLNEVLKKTNYSFKSALNGVFHFS
jgi:glycosyltransferase involved in cell wall biosynthesis